MSKRLWTADFRRIFLANLFLMVTYNMLYSVFLLFLDLRTDHASCGRLASGP